MVTFTCLCLCDCKIGVEECQRKKALSTMDVRGSCSGFASSVFRKTKRTGTEDVSCHETVHDQTEEGMNGRDCTAPVDSLFSLHHEKQ